MFCLSQGKCQLHHRPGCPVSALGAGHGTEIRCYCVHGSKEVQQWGFALVGEHQPRPLHKALLVPLPGVATGMSLSEEGWWQNRDALGLQLQLVHGEGHSCDPHPLLLLVPSPDGTACFHDDGGRLGEKNMGGKKKH